MDMCVGGRRRVAIYNNNNLVALVTPISPRYLRISARVVFTLYYEEGGGGGGDGALKTNRLAYFYHLAKPLALSLSHAALWQLISYPIRAMCQVA